MVKMRDLDKNKKKEIKKRQKRDENEIKKSKIDQKTREMVKMRENAFLETKKSEIWGRKAKIRGPAENKVEKRTRKAKNH